MWRKRSGALEAGCALQRDEGVGAESGSGNTSAASKRGSISGIGFMDPLYCNSGNIDQDYCDPCTEYFHSFLAPKFRNCDPDRHVHGTVLHPPLVPHLPVSGLSAAKVPYTFRTVMMPDN